MLPSLLTEGPHAQAHRGRCRPVTHPADDRCCPRSGGGVLQHLRAEQGVDHDPVPEHHGQVQQRLPELRRIGLVGRHAPDAGLGRELSFRRVPTDSIDWYDWNPTGTYAIRRDGAWDYNWDDMTQNSTKMTVKLGSRMSASSARSGKYVTVKGTATRYSPSAERYRGWAGTKVTLRQKSCSSCSWKTVKTVKTDRNGRVALKVNTRSKRYWQLSTKDSSNTWGRTSSTLKR